MTHPHSTTLIYMSFHIPSHHQLVVILTIHHHIHFTQQRANSLTTSSPSTHTGSTSKTHTVQTFTKTTTIQSHTCSPSQPDTNPPTITTTHPQPPPSSTKLPTHFRPHLRSLSTKHFLLRVRPRPRQRCTARRRSSRTTSPSRSSYSSSSISIRPSSTSPSSRAASWDSRATTTASWGFAMRT